MKTLAAIIKTDQSNVRRITNCNNCNNFINENFCSNCGQPATLKRIDSHYITHEIEHLLHFEKGFFFTVKDLFIKPGQSIREFIAENRNKHMKPVAFLILTSLLYTLVAHYFHAEEINNSKERLAFGKSSITTILDWVQTHYGYANIIMGIFIALFIKLLYKKYKYNFFEITVLLCFVMGQGMLLLAFEAFFVKLLNENIYKTILVVIAFAYPTWAIGQFFDKGKIGSYIKALLSYIFGYLLFQIAIIVVGLTTDLIVKIL